MVSFIYGRTGVVILIMVGFLLAGSGSAYPSIDGITGTNINLKAKAGHIQTGEGNNILIWGFAAGTSQVQYPGPTIIVNQGDHVKVTLTNELSVPVSIVFPGQANAHAEGGVPGVMTKEAPPGGIVKYEFDALEPGTYMYHSGTNPELQVEMGLAGALIVRPPVPKQAYNHPDSGYDREYLFFLSEMDANIHDLVELGKMDQVNATERNPVYWFINGRNWPDIFADPFVAWLPNQPYNCLPMMHPGERVLLRFIGAGHDPHPYHIHGNNAWVIARDGRLLSSDLSGFSTGADLMRSEYTLHVYPGTTMDAIFEWTGRDLGFDFYGHNLADPVEPYEVHAETTLSAGITDTDTTLNLSSIAGITNTHRFRAIIYTGASISDAANAGTYEVVELKKADPYNNADSSFDIRSRGMEGSTAQAWSAGAKVAYTDHGATFNGGDKLPVQIPNIQDVLVGPMYPGSPFLGDTGFLPPGEGGFNPYGAFVFPWHSHHEKEMVNFDVFIGGMLTFMYVLPPSVPIP